MKEKLKIERATLNTFLKAYNTDKENSFKLHKHRDKPDFEIINSRKQIVGIETTRLWETNFDAKSLLGRGKGFELMPVRSSEDVKQRLNELICKKWVDIEKYQYDHEVWLVIGENSPVNFFEVVDPDRFRIRNTKFLKHIFLISSYQGLIQLDE